MTCSRKHNNRIFLRILYSVLYIHTNSQLVWRLPIPGIILMIKINNNNRNYSTCMYSRIPNLVPNDLNLSITTKESKHYNSLQTRNRSVYCITVYPYTIL